jgi:hypothetical protein
VLLVAPSVPEFAGAYLGILAAGAIAVTANMMSTRPELEYLGSDAEVAVVGWSDVRPAPAAAALGVPYWPLAGGLAGRVAVAVIQDGSGEIGELARCRAPAAAIGVPEKIARRHAAGP